MDSSVNLSAPRDDWLICEATKIKYKLDEIPRHANLERNIHITFWIQWFKMKLEIWGRAQHEATRRPTSDLKYILGDSNVHKNLRGQHRRTSPTSVDQSQPSVADKDSDPPLAATSFSPPLSRTLAPVHLLWRVLRPGINCRCTLRARESVGSFKTALKSYFHFVD